MRAANTPLQKIIMPDDPRFADAWWNAYKGENPPRTYSLVEHVVVNMTAADIEAIRTVEERKKSVVADWRTEWTFRAWSDLCRTHRYGLADTDEDERRGAITLADMVFAHVSHAQVQLAYWADAETANG